GLTAATGPPREAGGSGTPDRRGADQGTDLAEQDRQGGQVGAGLVELADRLAGPGDAGRVDRLPLVDAVVGRLAAGGGAQDLGGEGGQGGVQVVAQRHPGQGLPAVLAGQV